MKSKQSFLTKLFLSGINIQEHLLADFVLGSPSVNLPRKHYLSEVEGRGTLVPSLKLDTGH